MATIKRNDSEDMQLEKSDIQVIENAGGLEGLDSIEDTKPGAFVWLCAAATAIGGMLFGCKYCSFPRGLGPIPYSPLSGKASSTEVEARPRAVLSILHATNNHS